jgi:hypothetical protein
MNDRKFEIRVQLKNKKNKTLSKNFKPWKGCMHHMDPDGNVEESFVMKKLRSNDFEEEIGNLVFKKAILVEVDLSVREKFELYIKHENMLTATPSSNSFNNRSETRNDGRYHDHDRFSNESKDRQHSTQRNKRPCYKFFDDDATCEYGDRCRFSHDRADFRRGNQKEKYGEFRSNLKSSIKNSSNKIKSDKVPPSQNVTKTKIIKQKSKKVKFVDSDSLQNKRVSKKETIVKSKPKSKPKPDDSDSDINIYDSDSE